MLTMKKADYEKILAHAKENLPEEACGLIAGTKDGDKKIIEKVYLLENMDHTNEHFSMNPKDQLAAVKDMRANKLVPLGNWHSHPESPSRPSEEVCIISLSLTWKKHVDCWTSILLHLRHISVRMLLMEFLHVCIWI